MSTTNYAFVRTEDAPTLPPPPSQTGVIGWLWRNMFSSMANYSTPGAAAQSLAMILLTLGVGWFGVSQILTLLDFALFSAIWADPDGVKREVCATTAQGGALPEDWFGACYPFIVARWDFLVYGFFPPPEYWRVNIIFLLGALGVGWLTLDAVARRRTLGVVLLALSAALAYVFTDINGEPFFIAQGAEGIEISRVGVWILAGLGLMYLLAPEDAPRKLVAVLMLTLFPLVSFVLLTGGNEDVSATFLAFWGLGGAALVGLGLAGGRGALGEVGSAFSGVALGFGALALALAGAAYVVSIDYGLETVPTDLWGGLLVTLIIAVAGIVFSLPLGILLALGRRSSLPAVRILSIAFIEFWRGVPLITVLFFSSVMLPLFLPDGTEFNKLMRALIGVMLFAAAYQAEVVRGGLQAIPKGQYEGAMAMGLSYWQMMRLVVLPQALVLVIPGIVNTFIGLFKDTTLVLIIGLFDLLGSVQSSLTDSSWATPVQAPTGYLVAAFIFFAFCFGMSRYSLFMERQLRRGHAR